MASEHLTDIDLSQDEWEVRNLRKGDQDRLVRIDERLTGRRRQAWYEGRLRRALTETDVHVSLGVDSDGVLVGALMGSVYYGEFGQAEPVAVLDTVLVDPEFRGRGVGQALYDQFTKNLRALRIEQVRTEVDWRELDLIGFLARQGFQPAPRLVLQATL